MFIRESAVAMNNDYMECVNSLGKIDLFAEASYREYEINLKEAALKVLKENGTEEDFDFFAYEAASGYIERAKKAIEKIIEAIKKFIRNCKENLIKMVNNAKTKAAIDKVDEVCKKNPKFRSVKVEYQDTDRHVGVIQKGIDGIRKHVAKIKAKGVATNEDIEEIEKIETDTMKKVAAIAAVSVVTIGAAIAIFGRCNSKSEIDNALNEDATSDCEMPINEDTAKNAETASYYTKASGLIAKLMREKSSKKVTKSTSLFSAIKKAISEFKGKNESVNLESTTIEDLPMFAYVTESSTEEVSESDVEEVTFESDNTNEGLDLDQYFNEMCEELFSTKTENELVDENAPIQENADQNDLTDEEEVAKENVAESKDDSELDVKECAETYLEQLESELFGEKEDVSFESAAQSLLDEMESLL